MKVTARIDFLKENPTNQFLGIATLIVDDCVAIKNVAIIKGKNGIFASMPQKAYMAKDDSIRYTKVAIPTTSASSKAFNEAVANAYYKALVNNKSTNDFYKCPDPSIFEYSVFCSKSKISDKISPALKSCLHHLRSKIC